MSDLDELMAGMGYAPALKPSRNGNGRSAPPPATLRVLNTARLLVTPPPPLDWIAEGIYAAGKLTLFGGREKGGKSLVQLALAVCMASGGGEIAGIAVKPGRVLIVDAENGEREIHRRLRAIGMDPAWADRLVLVEARGFDLRSNLGQLRALIDEHEPDLLLLDSFRALWRGDERDEAEVAAALDPLRELAHDRQLAVGLTHHAQKSGDEYRGSSAIGASVEWVVMLSRERDDIDRTRRKLSNPLSRFARERAPRWLSICSTDDDDGPVSLAAAEPFKRPNPRDEKAQAVLDVLDDTPRSEVSIAKLAEVPRATTQRILRDLETSGEAARHPGGGWVAGGAHAAHSYIDMGSGHPPDQEDIEQAEAPIERLFSEDGEAS